jgi:ectoine hydroxylase-related dioxygenase (phytanoyl-CoA dioxygenase family)
VIDQLTEDQVARFDADGFLILPKLIDRAEAEVVTARFEGLFKGRFETGLYPDEWNWQEGRDRPDRTRQICNGWKSDRTVASLVLRREIGRLCAQLGRWPGARVVQDNVIWKPPGAKSLGYHQDNAYADWIDPPAMLTCWIALDDTSAAGGTIEYVKGSHKWGRFPPAKEFHAPEDYRKEMIAAAHEIGKEPEIAFVEVPSRLVLARLRRQCRAAPAALGGHALHVVGGQVPSDACLVHLQPLQARRRYRNGRELLPDPLA